MLKYHYSTGLSRLTHPDFNTPHSPSSHRPRWPPTLSPHVLSGKRGPAYPDRRGPRERAGWRADSAERELRPLTLRSLPSAPDLLLGSSGPVRRAPSYPERPYAPLTKQHGCTTLPNRSSQLACSFTSLHTRARLTMPTPPLLRALAIPCVFAQPVSSREKARRRKTKRRRTNGGVASKDACGTRPALGLREISRADSI